MEGGGWRGRNVVDISCLYLFLMKKMKRKKWRRGGFIVLFLATCRLLHQLMACQVTNTDVLSCLFRVVR